MAGVPKADVVIYADDTELRDAWRAFVCAEEAECARARGEISAPSLSKVLAVYRAQAARDVVLVNRLRHADPATDADRIAALEAEVARLRDVALIVAKVMAMRSITGSSEIAFERLAHLLEPALGLRGDKPATWREVAKGMVALGGAKVPG